MSATIITILWGLTLARPAKRVEEASLASNLLSCLCRRGQARHSEDRSLLRETSHAITSHREHPPPSCLQQHLWRRASKAR